MGDGGQKRSRFAILAEVRAYWEGLRHGSALPRRDQIDPRGIAGALEQVFLVERIAPGLARFRLAGMGLSDLMGMDVRGMPISTLFEPASRNRLAGPLETLFHDRAALDVWLEAERGIGRPTLEARLILLPLVSTRGVTDLALGCLAVEGTVGRAPRRFAITALLTEALTAGDSAQPVRALAEDASPFFHRDASKSRPVPGRPHLRLVRSDE